MARAPKPRSTPEVPPHVNLDPEWLAANVGDPGRYKVIDGNTGKLIWQANAGMQQTLFDYTNPARPLGSPGKEFICNEILIGGPRGPGKSAAAINWVAQHFHVKGYKGLIVRVSNESMKEYIQEAEKIWLQMGAIRRGVPAEFHFPSGAALYTGYCAKLKDYDQYQGHEYQRMVIEEAQQIPSEELFARLLASNRSTIPGIPPQVLLTANPGGPGNAWLKARFVRVIDNDTGDWIPWKKPFRTANKQIRVYIPGHRNENPQLLKNDPHYYDKISDEALPEYIRRAWIEGDWDVSAGSFFPLFRARKMAKEPPEALHVIPAYNLPPWCHTWIACDWGHTHHTAAYWLTIGPDRRVHVVQEMVMAKMGSDEIGAEIAQRSLRFLHGMEKPHLRMYLSPDAFSTRDRNNMIADQIMTGIRTILGPGSSTLMAFTSQEQELSKTDMKTALAMREERLEISKISGNSIWITPANPDQRAGWSFMRNMFRWSPLGKTAVPDEDFANRLMREKGVLAYQEYFAKFASQAEEILPRTLIHDCCPILIDTIPKLICDPKRPEVVKKFDSSETDIGDDPADAYRYGLMAYRDHEHKIPLSVWLPNEVEQIAQRCNIGDDMTRRVMVARAAEARYRKLNMGADRPIAVPRDAISLRPR